MRAWVALLTLPVAIAVAGGQASAQESQIDPMRTASRASPSDASYALALGRALRRAGHDAEALQELRRGTGLPNGRTGDIGIELRWEIARVAIARRDFVQATAGCRTVAAVAGAAVAGHACMAEAHLLWKRASEMLVETAQALKDNPGASGPLGTYEAKVAEGLAFELEVKDAEAEASLRAAVGWKPDRSEAHLWLGRLLVRMLRHDEGVTELGKALQLDPGGPEANYELARVLPAGSKSVALLQKATHERPSYGLAWLRLAEDQLAQNHLAEARVAVDTVLKLEPQDPAVHVIAGRVALAEGHPDDAIREGQAALAILANSARAKLLIADAYAAKGEVDLAVENYQAAYGLDRADPAALVRASEACHAAGRDTSARAFGEKATKEFPQWGPGWVAYGDALVGQKETALARVAYQTALRSSGPVDTAAVQRKLASLH